MKIASVILLIVTTLALTSCSSTKYKTFSTADNFKTAGNLINGKSPKEASQILGKPMSVYYNSDSTVYYMIYPMGDQPVSMTDLMFNDRLECFSFNFEKEKDFKYSGWWSNTSFTCGAIKGEKLDTSLID